MIPQGYPLYVEWIGMPGVHPIVGWDQEGHEADSHLLPVIIYTSGDGRSETLVLNGSAKEGNEWRLAEGPVES